MGFCAKAKLDELARDLSPFGIRDVEVRERGGIGNDAKRVVVVVRYGEHGVATVDATRLETKDVEERVRAIEKKIKK